jgi:hypothetical protein
MEISDEEYRTIQEAVALMPMGSSDFSSLPPLQGNAF